MTVQAADSLINQMQGKPQDC